MTDLKNLCSNFCLSIGNEEPFQLKFRKKALDSIRLVGRVLPHNLTFSAFIVHLYVSWIWLID